MKKLSSPSTVISSWKADTETARTIASHDSILLTFEFEHDADKTDAYSIKINFNTGCSVEFKPGPPGPGPGPGPNECGTGTNYPSGYKISQLDLKYNHTAFCDSQTLGVCNDQLWGRKWMVTKGPVLDSLNAGTGDRIIESTGLLNIDVDNGGLISIKRTPLSALNSNTYITVYDSSTISEANKLEYDQIHTSCSAPIRIGDKFGSFEVVNIHLVAR
jgi:hypothetical protein